MKSLGVPYPNGTETIAIAQMQVQANRITKSLREAGIKAEEDKEIIAMIAYLQRLGTDIKKVQANEDPSAILIKPSVTNDNLTQK
jgi:cytochrome c oxidase cbb3-type subunit I/II